MSSAVNRARQTLWLGIGGVSWTACSVGMIVTNKLAVTVLPQACSLVSIQFAFTAVAMLLLAGRSIRLGSAKDVLRWCMVVPFFSGMILTSILALKSAPMTLVITFRSLAPALSLCAERFFPNPIRVSWPMLACLAGMIVGMMIYIYDMHTDHVTGIKWAMMNNLFAVGDRLLQRLMLSKDQKPVDISKSGITLLNNLLGMVPLLIAAVAVGELKELPASVLELDAVGGIWILASCFCGMGISYSGVWLQSRISATSFLVLINGSKFFVLFLEVSLMRDRTLGVPQLVGGAVTILASVAYGRARATMEKGSADTKASKPAKQPEAGEAQKLEEEALSNWPESPRGEALSSWPESPGGAVLDAIEIEAGTADTDNFVTSPRTSSGPKLMKASGP